MGGSPDRPSFERLPAVGTLLASSDLAPLIERHGRGLVTQAIRAAISDARESLCAGESPSEVTPAVVRAAVERLGVPSLRRVINGTGVVLHTNLGRAPLAEAARRAIDDVAAGYSTLEFDTVAGERGDRHVHASAILADLLNTDAGLVFNNCAGAVLAMLAASCRGGEVVVARGELVEIGGGFRVPEVMKESGATLVEVGTTNRVYVRDYEAAIGERTRAILSVHRSNFAIVGFTSEPTLAELSELAKERGLPLFVDLGSGLLADERDLGDAAQALRAEPRPARALADGADLVVFSGDKLLGGPQAGIVAGRDMFLDRIRVHPLARALRADKLTLAALEATLRLYRDGRAAEIPVIRDLACARDVLETRARCLAECLRRAESLPVAILEGESLPGGGSVPLARLPTKLVVLEAPGEAGRLLSLRLRESNPPLITRRVDDCVAIDVRTIRDSEIPEIVALVIGAQRVSSSRRVESAS